MAAASPPPARSLYDSARGAGAAHRSRNHFIDQLPRHRQLRLGLARAMRWHWRLFAGSGGTITAANTQIEERARSRWWCLYPRRFLGFSGDLIPATTNLDGCSVSGNTPAATAAAWPTSRWSPTPRIPPSRQHGWRRRRRRLASGPVHCSRVLRRLSKGARQHGHADGLLSQRQHRSRQRRRRRPTAN